MAKKQNTKQQTDKPLTEARERRETHYLRELEQVAQAHDMMLKPEDVIEFARDPKTALHSRFDWNNTNAAQQWRLFQARQLIRVSIRHIGGAIQTPIRAFVSLKSDRYQDGGGYRSMVTVLNDAERRAEMLRDALADLIAIRRKYNQLQELSQVFAAVDQLVRQTEAA